jgi:hypothetical protein
MHSENHGRASSRLSCTVMMHPRRWVKTLLIRWLDLHAMQSWIQEARPTCPICFRNNRRPRDPHPSRTLYCRHPDRPPHAANFRKYNQQHRMAIGGAAIHVLYIQCCVGAMRSWCQGESRCGLSAIMAIDEVFHPKYRYPCSI